MNASNKTNSATSNQKRKDNPASEKLDTFLQELAERHPNEQEFHDAVREFMQTVFPEVEDWETLHRDAVLDRLVEPDRIFSFRVCWEDDSGRVRVNRGYRVQFNSTLGPYKGGLRFHPSVNLGILKFLAFEQVFKNALTQLPLGGGKGGSDFNPRGKSDREVMRFCQSFMTELARHIGPDRDVPAGDIGVGEREIGYLYGQYKRLQDESRAVLTGKGVGYGGSVLRTEATGYGAVLFAETMLRRHKDGLEGKICALSGAGNVALFAAEKLTSLGARVVTLSDSDGFIHCPDGLDEEAIASIKELKFVQRGRLKEYAEATGCDYHADEAPWGVSCDLAFPCATQGELDGEAAKTLLKNGCLGVVEGANMPATLEAIDLFRRNKCYFAPGKAANAGGVAVSGLEMTQNSMRLSWDRERMEKELAAIMQTIHEQCVREGDEGDWVDYVKGANLASFKRVADAMLSLGIH
ncbi:NADP-specific glutamate dehydrogenase [Coraliomargarita sinensis]|uniref:Glutamate dehydrogenase n=1 Tax=Coraliomargarita sinensis TaxID=2174842 RepID=A0A317ZG43_9BACT|nr:NADP-specific glutamate dehydrogenase [Coraliomargarita sinensis]PXA03183.1 NADP-specific glutamate dehydrogenase [Coraliomargarita sinensis]